MNCCKPLNGLEDGAVGCAESESVPRDQVYVAGELGDGHEAAVEGSGGGGGLEVDGGGANPRSLGDESSEEVGGEALVGIAEGGGDVVEHPHHLLSQSDVVALHRGGAVEEKLLDARAVEVAQASGQSTGE